MSKLIESIKEAIEKTGLKSGMTISFHHHMRNGDYVLNMVLEEAARMGIRDLTVNASSIFDIHEPIIDHIKNGVVTGLECNYMGAKVGKAISQGILEKMCIRDRQWKSLIRTEEARIEITTSGFVMQKRTNWLLVHSAVFCIRTLWEEEILL